jgi:hypothetical protein
LRETRRFLAAETLDVVPVGASDVEAATGLFLGVEVFPASLEDHREGDVLLLLLLTAAAAAALDGSAAGK